MIHLLVDIWRLRATKPSEARFLMPACTLLGSQHAARSGYGLIDPVGLIHKVFSIIPAEGGTMTRPQVQ